MLELKPTINTKFLHAEQGPGASVLYTDQDGKKWLFEGGTRTWRNQNPGNMVVGKRSINNGMIGRAGGFAVFPDYQTGHNALLDLLKNEYGNFDLSKLMDKFAPPEQNATKKYVAFIKKKTGVVETILIKDYTAIQFEKLWQAIEKMEGWKTGKIREFSSKGQITKVKKDKKGKIVSYLIDGYGWMTKKKAISLAEEKKIDAVVVTRKGVTFLRSRPNLVSVDNLKELV